MPLAGSQRREQRRRLVLSWNRAATPSSPQPTTRRLADYSPEALPEHQPSPAVFLPTGLGGFATAATGLLFLLTATLGVGLWEAAIGGPAFGRDTTRFAATLASMRRCLDPRSVLSLGGWLSQLCLLAATATALIVRFMRRHRRDDYRGRYRAWGWLAGLFTLTSCAGQVPLGDLFGVFVSDATGISFGPNGLGWWVMTAGVLYAAVALWAVLPLHERAATGFWLSTSLTAWAAAAAFRWTAHGHEIPSGELHEIAGTVCWMTGGVLAAIAMLAASRSVLREVHGLPARKAGEKPTTPAEPAQTSRRSAAAASIAEQDDAHHDTPLRDDEDDTRRPRPGRTEFVDGGDAAEADGDFESSDRHLSKAERKRLRKLARMSRAA